MKYTGYLHPNLHPTSKVKYLNVIERIREVFDIHNNVVKILIPKDQFDILEDAAHPTMKGKGHACYGVPIEIGSGYQLVIICK